MQPRTPSAESQTIDIKAREILDKMVGELCELIESHNVTFDNDAGLIRLIAKTIFNALHMDGNVDRVITKANFEAEEPDLFSEIPTKNQEHSLSADNLQALFIALNELLTRPNLSKLIHDKLAPLVREGQALVATPENMLNASASAGSSTHSTVFSRSATPETAECVLVFNKTRGKAPLEFFNTDLGNLCDGKAFKSWTEAEEYLRTSSIRGTPILVELSIGTQDAKNLIKKRDHQALAKHVTSVYGSAVAFEKGQFVVKPK